MNVQPHLIGSLLALAVLFSTAATMYWMLHPPHTTADRAARVMDKDVDEMIGSVIIVFSAEIHSEHMMALAVRLAQRERAKLLAAFVVEVPHTLPVNAEMEKEKREALGVLATAEAIARQKNVEIATEIVSARNVATGVLELAKRHDAHLIVLGAYREGKYTGAPLGRAIEVISAQAPCDVLIGVQGNRGKILTPPRPHSKADTATIPVAARAGEG
jgi:nucleotide-binding universal stress UspA family protein